MTIEQLQEGESLQIQINMPKEMLKRLRKLRASDEIKCKLSTDNVDQHFMFMDSKMFYPIIDLEIKTQEKILAELEKKFKNL